MQVKRNLLHLWLPKKIESRKLKPAWNIQTCDNELHKAKAAATLSTL